MRFVYKIHSGYDRFTPARVPERLRPGNLLELGWDRYIDAVEKGYEVLVYFRGPHKFTPGVYAIGYIHDVDYDKREVTLRVREHSVSHPLITDPDTAKRIGEIVQQWYRQVFVLPEEVAAVADCDIATSATTCKFRKCTACSVWASLPTINAHAVGQPERLSNRVEAYVPAYWVIPSRCYLGSVSSDVRRSSEIFYRFKFGETSLSFPLALGMLEALRQRKLLEFDHIVPIPLSPDKAKRGEVHRTRLLAEELEVLLGAKVIELLGLGADVSKRRILSFGGTQRQFERRYEDALEVMQGIDGLRSLLLVDDVCTRGSTLEFAAKRILDAYPERSIVAVTAGQMIVKPVVRDESQLVT